MENKPICEIDIFGSKRWYLNGKLYREDGPAVEIYNGTKHWWINGQLHRLDGPAIIWNNGLKEWWINGHHVTDIITKWAKENGIDIDNLTDVDKALNKLSWADYGK